MVEIFNLYATIFFFLAIGFPLIGGALLFIGFQYAKVPGFTFVKTWKIYLTGLCYSYLVIWGILLVLKPTGEAKETPEPPIAPIVRTLLFYAVPMVAIPLLGRDFSRRTIAVELLAVLLANSIMIVVAYMTLPHLLKPQAENRRYAPVEPATPTPIPKGRKTDSQSGVFRATPGDQALGFNGSRALAGVTMEPGGHQQDLINGLRPRQKCPTFS